MAISTEAIFKTADMFCEEYPEVATLLKSSTYVDDIVTSVHSDIQAQLLADDTDVVLGLAGFKVKSWLIGGRAKDSIAVEKVKVLGVDWLPASDVVSFPPSINFSQNKRGASVSRCDDRSDTQWVSTQDDSQDGIRTDHAEL